MLSSCVRPMLSRCLKHSCLCCARGTWQAFSPDGKRFVLGLANSTARLNTPPRPAPCTPHGALEHPTHGRSSPRPRRESSPCTVLYVVYRVRCSTSTVLARGFARTPAAKVASPWLSPRRFVFCLIGATGHGGGRAHAGNFAQGRGRARGAHLERGLQVKRTRLVSPLSRGAATPPQRGRGVAPFPPNHQSQHRHQLPLPRT